VLPYLYYREKGRKGQQSFSRKKSIVLVQDFLSFNPEGEISGAAKGISTRTLSRNGHVLFELICREG